MKRLSTIALIAYLCGCSASSSVIPSTTLTPGNGLVVLKMSANTRLGVGSRYLYDLMVDEPGTTRLSSYMIKLSRRGTTNSGIYFGSLPAGQYRPVEIRSSGYNSSSWVTFPENFGTFTVEAGRVTDLGHMLVDTLYNNEMVFERGETIHDWIPKHTEAYFPNIPQSVFESKYLWWDPDYQGAQTQLAAYNRMRLTSKGFLNPTALADGSVLLGSLLGPIKYWIPGKPLQYLDAGFQGSVESTAEITEGVWLAGSEDGQVRITSDFGQTWQDFAPRFPGGSVVGLDIYDDEVIATVIGQEAITIYSSPIDAPGWRSIGSQPFKHPVWSDARLLVRSHRTGATLLTTLPMKELLVTNLSTSTTVVRDLPGKIREFTVGADGKARCVCTKGIGFTGFVSENFGQTWTREPAKLDTLAYYIDENIGYTMASTFLLMTEDAGLSWKPIAELPTNAIRLGYIEATSTLFATNRYDFLMFSNDGGVTWRSR